MQFRKYVLLTFLLSLFAVSAAAQNTGSISGTVTIDRASALHGAEVQIYQLKRIEHTDVDGRFMFTGIAPGRYTVVVHMEGFSDVTRTVDVVAGETINLAIELSIASIKEQVTVTASGAEQSVFDSFQTVNSVGSTRITEKAATSIGDVLDGETGVAKRSFGPGSSRPVIRGFDGDRVLILEDGVRTGSVGSQSGDHGETIDPLAAERIEVVKGPGTLLYGSNALGGVVNVIGHHDSDYHDGFRGFATGVGGSADRQAGFAGGLEYGYKRFLFRANTGFQRTGDVDTPIGSIPNSAARSANSAFSLGYFADKGYLKGSYGVDVRRYGIPFAALFEGGGEEDEASALAGVLPAPDEEIDVRARKYNYRVNGGLTNLTGSFISGLQFNVDHSLYRHKEIETADGIDEVGTIFDNRTTSARVMLEQSKYGRLSGRFGAEGFTREYEVNGAEQLIDGPVKHSSFSVFGLEELNFERVKFQFGGRLETNRYRPMDAALLDRSFTGFSGGAGVNIGVWKGGAVVANYTHSYRAPALEELYNNGPHIGNLTFEIGNDDLRAERSNGIDLSVRHQSRRVNLTADAFYYRIRDFIFLAPQDLDADGEIDVEDGLFVARYSQAAAEYSGVEFSGDVAINRWLSAFAAFDLVRARLRASQTDLPRIPPARTRLGIELRHGGLSVRPEAVFASRQDRVFPLETPTAGYGLVNVAASYTVGGQHIAHVFSVNAYNLTNKLYRNHVSFIKDLVPEIGRGVRFGYTIRFF